ncbi:MAG: FkbM family methyltransferase [Cyanobium sp. CZS 25K]|nr:FkbM family methyltransferase [Cyanobium sp. CZS25K]
MLIPLQDLPTARIRGIIHVGAHEAEELDSYAAYGITRVVWIEANPDKASLLTAKLAGYRDMRLGMFAAADNDGGVVDLNIANNGQSSSVLAMGLHATAYPQIHYTSKVQVPRRSIDAFMESEQLERDKYNFLNLDIQGSELSALVGASIQLKYVDYVYTEVNTERLYENCCTLSEIDSYLTCYNFSRIALTMTRQGWGDAFYAKNADGRNLSQLGGRSSPVSIKIRRFLAKLF